MSRQALLLVCALFLAPVPGHAQHDFDFEIGTWNTHLKRLMRPLTGSTTWVEYQGTTVVRKVWDGRANLVELEVDGPAGHIQGLSLRIYNPDTRQWSLNFSNSVVGTLSPPAIGEFKNGRGEFFNDDTLNGRPIRVRFVISDITPTSARFEQAFSEDGGKTWEVNWIATDTRTTDESTNPAASVQETPLVVTPKEVAWRACSAALPPGVQCAILEGDPTVADRLFTSQVRLPDGYRIAPHFHPADEHLTVISGTFNLGHGRTFDNGALTALSAGGYAVMPKGHAHFATTSGETVVQIHAIGPWTFTYVNPADDPRNR